MTTDTHALYLGDGAYVQFDEDHYSVILTTGTHELHKAENTVYLDPRVLRSLAEWLAKHRPGVLRSALGREGEG